MLAIQFILPAKNWSGDLFTFRNCCFSSPEVILKLIVTKT